MAHAPSVLDAKSKDLKAASTALKEMLAEDSAVVKNAAHLHGLCGGLKSGEVTIKGDSGDYLGVVNSGAWIKTAGTVIVEGNADFGAAQYCYGGTVVIKGGAGDFTATMNKGAAIIIGGDVGDEAATYMVAGDVVVVGNAGDNLGNYLIRGNIYVGGEWASLGHNCSVGGVESGDIRRLESWLQEFGLDADAKAFRKITPLSDKPFYSH
jgi:glutamate synthase domain-containing protein 3